MTGAAVSTHPLREHADAARGDGAGEPGGGELARRVNIVRTGKAWAIDDNLANALATLKPYLGHKSVGADALCARELTGAQQRSSPPGCATARSGG